MNDELLSPQAVEEICRHMNVDHAADTLLICQWVGGCVEATSAQVVGVDAGGLDLRAQLAEGTANVRVLFATPATTRAQAREEIVRLYDQATRTGGPPVATDGGVPSVDTLAERIKAHTWATHQRTERSPFVRALFGGQLPLAGYVELAAQGWFIYQVLEEAAEAMRDDQVGRRFVFDELTRLPALEDDLAHLLGEEWRELIGPTPAVQRYCERMREVCFSWPGGYVAHHYTRYLGDLSGGRAIGGVVARHYDLTGPGVSFYRFDAIDDVRAFKDEYRRRLDEAPWDQAEQERIIAEVARAYELNTEVFDDLDRAVGSRAVS